MLPLFFALLSIYGPLASATIVCLGDSLTAGYGLLETEAWPALVQAKFEKEASPWKLVNAGLSGDTSAGGLRRLHWQLKSSPEAVLVALGANDGLRGIEINETEKNLDEISRRARAAGAQLLLAGMELPSNYGEARRAQFRSVYKKLAAKHQAALLPFLLEGVGGVAELNLSDGIHPNEAGQIRVAETVYAFLKKNLRAPKSSGAIQKKKAVRSKKDMGK